MGLQVWLKSMSNKNQFSLWIILQIQKNATRNFWCEGGKNKVLACALTHGREKENLAFTVSA